MERQQLHRDRASLTRHIADLDSQLRKLDTECTDGKGHAWGEVRFNPIYRESYVIPSDAEMGIELGVDSRPRTYVPSETTRRWTKSCEKCGLDEHTTHTKKVTVTGRISGTTAEEEVPVFQEPRR